MTYNIRKNEVYQMTIYLRNYAIRPDDTINYIAEKFNTTADTLLILNPFLRYGLLINQIIYVPYINENDINFQNGHAII
jgi:spore germination protein YaaH